MTARALALILLLTAGAAQAGVSGPTLEINNAYDGILEVRWETGGDDAGIYVRSTGAAIGLEEPVEAQIAAFSSDASFFSLDAVQGTGPNGERGFWVAFIDPRHHKRVSAVFVGVDGTVADLDGDGVFDPSTEGIDISGHDSAREVACASSGEDEGAVCVWRTRFPAEFYGCGPLFTGGVPECDVQQITSGDDMTNPALLWSDQYDVYIYFGTHGIGDTKDIRSVALTPSAEIVDRDGDGTAEPGSDEAVVLGGGGRHIVGSAAQTPEGTVLVYSWAPDWDSDGVLESVLVGADGQVTGGPHVIDAAIGSDVAHNDLAFSLETGLKIAWSHSDESGDAFDWDIYVRVLDHEGTPIGDPTLLIEGKDSQYGVTAIPNPECETTVVGTVDSSTSELWVVHDAEPTCVAAGDDDDDDGEPDIDISSSDPHVYEYGWYDGLSSSRPEVEGDVRFDLNDKGIDAVYIFDVSNVGAADLEIGDITFESEADIEHRRGCVDSTVAPGASCSMQVFINPETTWVVAMMQIESNDPDEDPLLVGLRLKDSPVCQAAGRSTSPALLALVGVAAIIRRRRRLSP